MKENRWYWVKTHTTAHWQVAFVFNDGYQLVYSLSGEQGDWPITDLFEVGSEIKEPT